MMHLGMSCPAAPTTYVHSQMPSTFQPFEIICISLWSLQSKAYFLCGNKFFMYACDHVLYGYSHFLLFYLHVCIFNALEWKIIYEKSVMLWCLCQLWCVACCTYYNTIYTFINRYLPVYILQFSGWCSFLFLLFWTNFCHKYA